MYYIFFSNVIFTVILDIFLIRWKFILSIDSSFIYLDNIRVYFECIFIYLDENILSIFNTDADAAAQNIVVNND